MSQCTCIIVFIGLVSTYNMKNESFPVSLVLYTPVDDLFKLYHAAGLFS